MAIASVLLQHYRGVEGDKAEQTRQFLSLLSSSSSSMQKIEGRGHVFSPEKTNRFWVRSGTWK